MAKRGIVKRELSRDIIAGMEKLFKRLILTRNAKILSLGFDEIGFYRFNGKMFIQGIDPLFTKETIKKIEFVLDNIRVDDEGFRLQYEVMGMTGLVRYYFTIKTDTHILEIEVPVEDFSRFQFFYNLDYMTLDIHFVYTSEINLKYGREDIHPEVVKTLEKYGQTTIMGNEMSQILTLKYDDEEDWWKVVKDLVEVNELQKPYIEVYKCDEHACIKLGEPPEEEE